MTQLSDDQLEALLTETFRAHEHLADPDRAVALTRAPAPAHHGRMLFGAAAAVAVVATGATLALAGNTDSPAGPEAGPTSPGTGTPTLPPLQTNAGNRAAAVRAAERAIREVSAYPGARVSGPVPVLAKMGVLTSGPPGHTVLRSRWWIAPGSGAQGVSHWYAGHAPQGFTSEGGVNSSSSSGPGQPTVTVYAVDYDRPGSTTTQQGVSIEVETTAVPSGTAVRATVLSAWAPARPLASYVQDVTSIDVSVTHERYGRKVHTTHRSFTVTDPAKVLAVAVAYDKLPGVTPEIHSCPMIRDVYTDRVTFHTPHGDLVAVNTSSACGFGIQVSRDGHAVAPQLGNAPSFLSTLGLFH
jgi:hypothetical protein